MEYNIVGDIAGHHDTLMALLAQMPAAATPLSVGDLVDRGHRSRQVVEFFLDRPAVLGNHEHMLIDAVLGDRYYEDGVWYQNGGLPTILSYVDLTAEIQAGLLGWHQCLERFRAALPPAHLDRLRGLPLYLDLGELLVSHAPINPSIPFEQTWELGSHALSRQADQSIIWNRGLPHRIPGRFQVYGHNTSPEPMWHQDEEGCWGVGIDTARYGLLTGLHWPSRQIYRQPLLESDLYLKDRA